MKMTSDAKIGLLLGLIFIFIIAFILNGLPGLHGKGGANQVTAKDLTDLSSSATDVGPTQPAGVASDMAPAAGTGNEDLRYKISLGGAPADKTGVVSGLAPAGGTPSPLCPTDANGASPKVAQDVKDGVLDITSPEPAPKADLVAGVTGDVQSTAVDAPKANEYTIASGDSPAKIAVKAYGPKDGVKPANVSRIMSANNIKDPTKLVVGKKLQIPALPTGPEKLTVTNPDSFSKVGTGATSSRSTVKSDARTNPDLKPEPKATTKSDAKTNPDVKPAPKGAKEYTVVSGDNLWKIAAKTLGDRSRYDDILKLNSGKLGKDGSKLSVGMKLQIPAK
jgi:nucleoid-associated protein YgaU